MKLLITSDLHIEWDKKQNLKLNFSKNIDYDLLIIAGDISNRTELTAQYLESLAKEVPNIFWIPGNHDLWDLDHTTYNPYIPWRNSKTIEETYKIYESISGYGNRKIINIGNQRILGCTLWYNLDDDKKHKWTDYQYINDWWNLKEQAKLDYEFLYNNLQENDIVVTHMLPSHECISAQYLLSPDNKYYVTPVSDLIKKRKPKLWISGHSHDRMVKMIHNHTLYIRNPRGYGNQENSKYSHIVVDVNKISEYDCVYDIGQSLTFESK